MGEEEGGGCGGGGTEEEIGKESEFDGDGDDALSDELDFDFGAGEENREG